MRHAGKLAYAAAFLFVLACQSDRRQEPALEISDEQIIAWKPAGTNALILHFTGPGPAYVAGTDGAEFECVNFEEGGSAKRAICWAYEAVGSSPISVTFAPGVDWVFQGWSAGPCDGAACAVTMDRDWSVSVSYGRAPAAPPPAFFRLTVVVPGPIRIEPTITATPDIGLSCGPSPTVTYAYACSATVPNAVPPRTVTISAEYASPEYDFAGWTGDCSGPTCTVTIAQDTRVSASWVRRTGGEPPQNAPVVTLSPLSFEGTVSTTEYVTFNYTSSVPGVAWACYVTDPIYGKSLVANPCYPPLTMGFRDGQNTLTVTATTVDGVTGAASYTFVQQTGSVVCAAGLGNCDGNAANGCESSLASDVNNCGACGNVCPTIANGTAGCSGGVCGVASCDPGFSAGASACVQDDGVKLVFVSSKLYTGNLGGVAGAHAKCQALAEAAGLAGTFKAWVSDALGHSPSTEFTRPTGRYVLKDGTTVAQGWAGLTSGSLQHAINQTELGGPAPLGSTATFACASGVSMPWTGTFQDGQPYIWDSCGNWTTTAGGALWGRADGIGFGYAWSNYCSGGSCEWTSPIYCFQQ